MGSEIVRRLDGRLEVHAPGRGDLDLESPDSIRRAIHAIRPDLLINAAAYTAVDAAETDPDTAIAVNARAVRVLGEEAHHRAFPVVHYSTDYVFDGTATRPYRESDVSAPLSVYGRTKCLGDSALASSGAAFLAMRVGWVYSDRPGNFLTTMLRLMSERPSLRVVADQVGAPTWSRHIAQATVDALEHLAGPAEEWTRTALLSGLRSRGGLYHLSPEGETSWYGFAMEILRLASLDGAFPLRVEEIVPIVTDEWPAAAPRPAYATLSSRRLASELDVRLPSWREGVSACLVELGKTGAGVQPPVARRVCV